MPGGHAAMTEARLPLSPGRQLFFTAFFLLLFFTDKLVL